MPQLRPITSLVIFSAIGLSSIAGAQDPTTERRRETINELLTNWARPARIAGLTALEKHGASLNSTQRGELAWHAALLLADSEGAVRTAAIDTLLALAPNLAGHREALEELIVPPDDEWNTAIGLGGRVARGSRIPNLLPAARMLASDNVRDRVRAVETLCRARDAASPHLDAVLALLKDPEPEVRAVVAARVARIEWNEDVRTALIGALRDIDASVRKSAGEGIKFKDDPIVVTALRGALQDPDEAVRVTIVQAIGNAGTSGVAAANDLIATLRDREAKVRVAALASIANLDIATPRAVEEIGRCFQSEDVAEVTQALTTAGSLGQPASALLDRCLTMIDHKDPELGRLAMAAAWSVSLETPAQRGRTVCKFIECLNHKDEDLGNFARSTVYEWIH